VQLGALATGSLLVPCSSMLRSKDIEFRANDCNATSIVVHESLTDMVEPILDETPLERVIVLDGTGRIYTARIGRPPQTLWLMNRPTTTARS